MSLLSGRHVASVVPLEPPVDFDSGPVEGEPVEWRCNVQPISAELATSLGYDFTTTFRLSGRAWPGGSMARVRVLSGPWAGRDFESIGEPLLHRMSASTSHDVIFVKAVGATWQRPG